jgi:hypothetical protein
MTRIWARLKEDKHYQDTYLDELVVVNAAGYLREYVWVFFRTPAWGAPPDGLKLKEFFDWRLTHLRGHKPQTLAAVKLAKPEKPVSAWSYDAKTATYRHYYSGYSFPRKVGPFERGELRVYDANERDVSVGYTARGPLVLTAYVYPLGSPDSEATESLEVEYHRRIKELSLYHPGANLLSERRGEISIQGRTLSGMEAIFAFANDGSPQFGPHDVLHSRLVLCVDGEVFFKVRMTYPDAAADYAAQALEEFLREFHGP